MIGSHYFAQSAEESYLKSFQLLSKMYIYKENRINVTLYFSTSYVFAIVVLRTQPLGIKFCPSVQYLHYSPDSVVTVSFLPITVVAVFFILIINHTDFGCLQIFLVLSNKTTSSSQRMLFMISPFISITQRNKTNILGNIYLEEEIPLDSKHLFSTSFS